MIAYIRGNIFESPAQTLVNTVNTVGVMGKGIAKEFKGLFPEMFKQYQVYCESGELTVGKLWLYKTEFKWILNFPTKTTWRQPSELGYIEIGLKNFVSTYADRGITSISFPPLGCGNGELNWEEQVRPLMEKYLNKLSIDIFIHLYTPEADLVPEHRNIDKIEHWLKSEPTYLSFDEVYKDLTFFVSDWTPLFADLSVKINNSKGIEIKEKDSKSLIALEDLRDFWQVFRNYGYILRSVVPPSLNKYYKVLVALFEKLPYCKKLNVSQKYAELDHSFGLQLKPVDKDKLQGDLFKLA